MSYLDDVNVTLRNGDYDERGAVRYGKPVSVPASYVVDLQQHLNGMGFNCGEPDGAFGNITERALTEFQAAARTEIRSTADGMIDVSVTFSGQVNGQCDASTKTELALWLQRGYKRSLITPNRWNAPSTPQQVMNAPLAQLMAENCYWPVRTAHPRGREVSFLDVNGSFVGRSSRRFLADRRNDRYHVGIDLWGDENDVVVAAEDGIVVNHYHFYEGVYALLVQHPASGIVINYGEVHEGSWRQFGVDIGTPVRAGQPIALVGRMPNSSMCHFETYTAGTTQNCRWYAHDPHRPAALLNPTAYLIELAARGH